MQWDLNKRFLIESSCSVKWRIPLSFLSLSDVIMMQVQKLVPVLAQMEIHGIGVSRLHFHKHHKELSHRLKYLEARFPLFVLICCHICIIIFSGSVHLPAMALFF
jgi:hypothetical protein